MAGRDQGCCPTSYKAWDRSHDSYQDQNVDNSELDKPCPRASQSLWEARKLCIGKKEGTQSAAAQNARTRPARLGANSGLAHGPGARPARAHLRGSAPGWCAVASGPWAPARAAISCSRPRASRCLSGAAPVHPAKWLPRARRGSEALLPGRCSRRPPEGAPRPRLGLPATSGRPGRPRPFPAPAPPQRPWG